MSTSSNIENIESDQKVSQKRDKRTRNALTALEKSKIKSAGFITKELEDPDNLLGKKHRQRLEKQSEQSEHVSYSINKQKRWTQLEPSSILKNTFGDVPEYVYERSLGSEKVNAVHTIGQDGELKTSKAKGAGCKAESLTSKPEEKKKTAPKVVYNVELVNAHTKVNKPPKGIWKGSKTRHFDMDLDDVDDELEDFSEDEAEEEQLHHSLTIQDCIVEKNCEYERVRPTVNIANGDLRDGILKPFDLLDLSKAVGNSAFFQTMNFNTQNWKKFDFEEQAKELENCNLLVVKRLDGQRILVNASMLANVKSNPEPFFMLMIEKINLKNQLAVTVNFTSVENQKNAQLGVRAALKDAGSLMEVVLYISEVARSWILESPAASGRINEARDMYSSTMNSSLLTAASQHVEYDEMVQLIKKNTASTSSEGEKDCEVKNCFDCQKIRKNYMYQLSNGWGCKKCLAHKIITMIRSGEDPLAMDFILPPGLTTYDILPAIIPINLVNFFTKRRAEQILLTGSSRRFSNCTVCDHVVIVEAEAEYGAYECQKCHSSWCEQCRSEPHFPMTCEQYKEWIQRWDVAYVLQYLGSDVLLLTCWCGTELECYETDEVTCYKCKTIHYGSQLKKTYDSLEARGPHADKYKYGDRLNVRMATFGNRVNSQVVKHCGEARQLRLSTSEFDKMLTGLDYPDTNGLRQLRNAVLFIVENGLAWIYMKKDKNYPQELKHTLILLKKEWKQLEFDIGLRRPDLATKVSKVERSLQNVLLIMKQCSN